MFHEANLMGKFSFEPEIMPLEGLDQTEQEHKLGEKNEPTPASCGPVGILALELIPDSVSQLNEDEQLARALRECLSIKSPPLQANQNCSWQGYGYGNGKLYQLLTTPYTQVVGSIVVHDNSCLVSTQRLWNSYPIR